MKILTLIVSLCLAACTGTVDRVGTETQGVFVGLNLATAGIMVLPAGDTDNLYLDHYCEALYSGCNLQGDSSGTSAVTGFDDTYFQCSTSFYLYNSSAYPITIRHNNANSRAAGRFGLITGHDEVLRPSHSMFFFCDANMATPSWLEYSPSSAMDVVTVSTPTRSLGTAFQPSALRPTQVHYSVQIDSTLTVSGGAAGRIEILSDSSNPPTTIRESVPGGLTGTVVLGVSQVGTSGGVLSYLVPASDWVLLRSVTVSGTPTYTITRQAEEAL